ncbi:MAG: coproporphyrinogen dehydrogenase HemZ [Tissierellaceae bacterium]|nr:coproporphyrinogen dehydrogenase HemZ [Tissierellaceae bacterium]
MINLIKVSIEGHSYKHDLFELIRVFFPGEEIVFIDENDYQNDGLFIYSSLLDKINNTLAITKVYKDNEQIKETVIDIEKIHISGLTRKKIIKNAIKKSIYTSLIGLVEHDIPWGILTGIRPIKVAHDLINTNLETDEVKRILMDEYRISDSKSQLMIDVAKSQRKHIYPLNQNKYSLYIGIPFCPTRCSYCSFPAFAIGNNYDKVSRYVDTLIYEIKQISKLMEGKDLNTVYIGGGTPTSIKIKDLERIIATVRDVFVNEDIKEFTVEAGRPDTLNLDMLKMLKSMDIDRISINPQTMNSKTLEKIGRNHDIESTIFSYNLAKELGFESINMDLIMGLPGEGIDEVAYTLSEIKKLDPENLTVHTLSLKRGSRLFNHRDELAKETIEINKMLELTEIKASEMDMFPYYLYRQKQILGNLENIGYAKPNKECIYNISMMEEKETIIGAGLGSVSKFYYPKENRIQRLPNFKDLIEYSNRIDELIEKKKNMIVN